MNIDPEYSAVGRFFADNPVYTIPIYQRGYAWEKEEIDDFLKDLGLVFNARKSGKPKNHFLGSIVTVQHKLAGVVGKHRHELVDGQQRATTFVLLAAAICDQYKNIMTICNKIGDVGTEKIAKSRLISLENRFIEFEQEVNRTFSIQPVLTLSKADNSFFVELIKGNNPDATLRDSHKRLKSAYESIKKHIKKLAEDRDINTYLDNLETLVQNIDGDFFLLRIITYNKSEAYSLFQVLNDRGKSLTEGDLLRAKTLEMLEEYPTQQTSVEQFWDNILKDKTNQTENFLRWIYASHKGFRPGTNTLFDDCLSAFYPESEKNTLTSAEADSVFLTTQTIKYEIENARKLEQGEWIFPFAQPITAWDRNRLSLLMRELQNNSSMPLLLAAAQLDHKKFAELVSLVERMMFRYTIVCGQHHSFITEIYESEAVEIRRNASGYNLSSLKTKLQGLLNTRADDRLFRASLDSLIFKKNGGSNKPLKYFLITLEDYWRWYHEDGAVGLPICKDKSRLYQFADTTIEHIYPFNASGAEYNVATDELKNTIGNLTILGAADNSTIGNDSFTAKRPIFRASSVSMNHEIADEISWPRVNILRRTDKLKNMALKIFKMD
jgi:hypothetical protein